MAEPIFRMLEMLVPPVVAANGTKVTYHGLENIPERGGALMAVNHTSYIDWLPPGLAALQRRRRLKFMIKAEMQQVRPVNFVIKHIGLIPVDRRAGADAYAVAVQRLKEGRLIGVHPEATISRSFELKQFKTGAARMAEAADVPLIPCTVWGIHRIWTKDHPKKLWRNKIPVLMKIGEPLHPAETVEQTTAALHEAMTALLHQAQEEYAHPAGAYWVPQRLGGGAPSMAEALQLRDVELAERVREREAPVPEALPRGRWRKRAAT